MKFCILKNDLEFKSILDYLILKLGLPSIQNRMNIYPTNNKFQLQFVNNKIFFKDSLNGKFFILKNKNLKTFFNFAQNQCNDGFRIKDIILFEFEKARLLLGTFHGNVLYVGEELLDELIKKGFKIEIYNKASEHVLKDRKSVV